MKRSKIALLATTTLLAFAAFATSRTHKILTGACTTQGTSQGTPECVTIQGPWAGSAPVTCKVGSNKLVTCINPVLQNRKTLYVNTLN
jgi:hypothetical protein